MGVKLNRTKNYGWWVKILYWIKKILPFSNTQKLKLFLNLEWIFWRFAHEASFQQYNVLKHPFRIEALVFLEKHLGKDFNVVDLGCARGEVTVLVAKHVKRVVAIDYNASHIEQATKNHSADNIEYICGEALAFLEKNKTKFDVLILSHILEHLDDPAAFIKQFKDFFKFIYIELPDFEKSYLNVYRDKLDMNLIFTDDDHISEFDRAEILTLLEGNNIKCIDSEFKYGVQRHWCEVL